MACICGDSQKADALEKNKTVAVIIAGGLSRRMGGGHKALRHLAGRPIIDHVWTMVSPQVARMALNVNGPSGGFTAVLPRAPVLADAATGHGPLAGVLVGLCWAAQIGAVRLLTIPSDTPFLPHDLVVRLIDVKNKTATHVVCARSAGRLHPLVSVWDVTLLSAVATFLAMGNRAVKDFLWTCQFSVVDFATTPLDPFMNMNTRADLRAAELIAQRVLYIKN